MKLGTGMDAPEFSATACFEGGRCDWKLTEQLKKAPVLLVFFPRDFETFSTARLCALRDSWEQLKKGQAQLVAVSSSHEDTHELFLKAYDFPFPLLADPAKTLFRSFGMLALGAPRSGLALIGKDKKIRAISRHVLPFRGPTAAETLGMMEHARA